MRAMLDTLDPRPYWRPEFAKPTLLLMMASILPTIHYYVGSIDFATRVLTLNRSLSIQYMFAMAFVLFGLVPFVAIKLFGETAAENGLRIGDWRLGLKFTAWSYPVVVLLTLLPGAYTPELRAFYPFDKDAHHSMSVLATLELTRLALFYSAWEFFFRGVLLFGLRKAVGDWYAILIQVIPSCLWHLGMPASEIGSSILAGVCFGMLALRTNSILWPLLVHFLIGLGMDVLIIVLS